MNDVRLLPLIGSHDQRCSMLSAFPPQCLVIAIPLTDITPEGISGNKVKDAERK
jgi:hypothetical protein